MPEHAESNPDNHLENIVATYSWLDRETLDLTNKFLHDEKVAHHLEFLKNHHEVSYNHCLRVGALSVFLSHKNGLDPTETKLTGMGGLLHDLGKCAIPVELLNKTKNRTEEERLLIETHAREGFARLQDPAFDGIREVVVAHHELKAEDPYPRDRGNPNSIAFPQPNRRNGEKKLYDRVSIVSAADIFDALTVKRTYNPEFTLDEIADRAHHEFMGDPKLIDQILSKHRQGH